MVGLELGELVGDADVGKSVGLSVGEVEGAALGELVGGVDVGGAVGLAKELRVGLGLGGSPAQPP
jgi:hypothetical protein